jgi:hypothetical protein
VGRERVDFRAADRIHEPLGKPSVHRAYRARIVDRSLGQRARIEHELDAPSSPDASRRKSVAANVRFECIDGVRSVGKRGVGASLFAADGAGRSATSV